MSFNKNGSQRREMRKARIDFLKQHPELWETSRLNIVNALKAVGLLAPSTYWADINTSLYIEEVKGEIKSEQNK
jgi:hypothetical protein